MIYDPGAFWDDGVLADGSARPGIEGVLERVGADPAGALETAHGLVRKHGIVFGKGDAEQDFVLDPIPRIVEAAEWEELERGLAQRARALNALLADAYGERRIVTEGVIPARVIDTAEYFERGIEGLVGERAATVIGFDLVRDGDGRFLVLEDNTRTPSGLAYATAAREVSADFFEDVMGEVRPLDPVFEWLGVVLREAAPNGSGEPLVVLLSDGPHNSAWYEHTVIAERVGIPLVQPDDLVVEGDELRLRTADTDRRVDVVLRRTDADRAAEPGAGLTWVGEMLSGPLRAGKLRMVNTFGSGLADDKLVYAYVPEAIRFYLDEEPLVAQIPTLDCADPDSLEHVSDHASELVIKPRFESGGIGVTVGSQADAQEIRESVAKLRRTPQEYIAQDIVSISTCPTVAGDAIEPRHVDLRAFAICGRDEVRLMPGGLTRVALRKGSLIVNSSQGGGGKDTWVVG
ncbi:MAG TPA: circularly permuted type 2 ATP-grasp protein [Solirubrobacterales bacterium]|nr:circularly permuted type 2 ATP-grasp protein [Solirubrobacterales bacterium]